MTVMTREVGGLIREWRQRRRLSQLALASEAEISQRHLSFLESGRSRPSREMLLHLCEQLEVPLRERNLLLVAGGFAPHYPQRAYDDPEMAAARDVVGQVLAAHEPFPALAVDRHWTMLTANRAIAPLLDGVALSEPGPQARLAIVIEHLHASAAFYGLPLGLKMFRKHLGWYIEQAPWPSDPQQRRAAKARICRLETTEAVETAMAELWNPTVAHFHDLGVENGPQLADSAVA